MILKPIYIVLFASCLGFNLLNLKAQQYNISRFTSKDGLAQNQCRSIATDSLGYLWVGTFEGGISRYNGNEFLNYSKKKNLGSNFIFKVATAKNNHMWFATENGVISIFGKKIEHYATGDSIKTKVEALAVDTNNQVWFGHPAKGVGIIKEGEVTYPDIHFEGEKDIIRIFCDKQNGIWFSTMGHGLYRYHNSTISKVQLSKEGLTGENILSFFAKPDGSYYLGSTNGLFELSADLLSLNEVHPRLNNKTITSIFQDSKNRTWFGTLYGAYYLKHGQLNLLSTANGLTEYIYDLTEDFEGGIWFSTNRGIYRLNNDFFLTFNNSHGLKDNLVWSVGFDAKGRTWLSTEAGISVLENQQSIKIKGLPAALDFWASPIVSDTEENLYIGSVSTIYKYDGNTFTKFVLEGYEEEVFFTAALKRKNGDILFAGSHGVAVLQNGVFKELISSKLLKEYKVNSLVEDAKERLWIATEGGGIFISKEPKESGETITELKQIYTGNGILVNDIVNVIYKDKNNHIWMGTSGNGLFKFPKSNFKQKPVSFEDADLNSSNVYSIIDDDSGNIWAGTDQGLNKICILQNDFVKVKSYGEQEGFNPLEVCHNAVTKDQEGNLWFGTVEGVVRVNPKEDAYSNSLPRIRIDDIQVFFRDIDWQDFADQTDIYTGLPLNSIPQLPNEDNHLVFYFSGIGYTIPSKIRYQWKLEGLDREWAPPSSIKEAIYPNIPPGKYTLQIKAINAAGITNEKPYSFSFEIVKPFYQTRAFMLFAVIFCFTLAYFYYKSRVNNLKRYQQRLEFKVRQRTKEIEEQHDKMRTQSKKLGVAMKEIDKKNQELIKAYKSQQNSLAYASKIQNAVMYADNSLIKCLPNSFIFSQPKELVSSDFYWTKEYDDHIFVILVDCTGHGVPGAFLSMIGFEYLTEIVDLMNIHEPAEILTILNKKISKALSHSQDKELVDGMDVAICRINKKSNTLTFSGARRPLHYIQNNKLHVIKGHFSGAGINLQNEEPNFKNVEINLQPDTSIYLFSDGFPNQFNKKGEKFKISNFKKLLLSITEIETEIEKVTNLSLCLNNWIQGGEQLDDVLVIGFTYYDDHVTEPSKKEIHTLKNTDQI